MRMLQCQVFWLDGAQWPRRFAPARQGVEADAVADAPGGEHLARGGLGQFQPSSTTAPEPARTGGRPRRPHPASASGVPGRAGAAIIGPVRRCATLRAWSQVPARSSMHYNGSGRDRRTDVGRRPRHHRSAPGIKDVCRYTAGGILGYEHRSAPQHGKVTIARCGLTGKRSDGLSVGEVPFKSMLPLGLTCRLPWIS